LVLYAQPGTTNKLEATPAVDPPITWSFHSEVVMTNLYHTIHLAPTNSNMYFFRAFRGP